MLILNIEDKVNSTAPVCEAWYFKNLEPLLFASKQLQNN